MGTSRSSELLTRPPWETAQNQMNGEADNAVSFCIVAVSSGLSCTSRRKVLTELASHPHWAWVFAYQGADQNLSAFLLPARIPLASPPNSNGEPSGTTCIPPPFRL